MMSGGGGADTVGSLLASIAMSLTEALRILMFADKRQWGPDEFEQIRVLEAALDEAKKDFQEMAPLVHGQFYYQNDRTGASLVELRALQAKFAAHAQNFRDWVRTGGPINPIWARETSELKRDLHRAQCRAARRIFSAEQDQPRCLGAFQVYRQQRRAEAERARRQRAQSERPPWQQQHEQEVEAQQQQDQGTAEPGNPSRRKTSLEDLVPVCNSVGRFERLGRHDAAYVCDFCDGFLIWHDILRVPAARTPLPPGSTYPNWQATGLTSGAEDGVPVGTEKQVVFPPLAIANHVPPDEGDFRARILCPYCDEYTYLDQGGQDSEEEMRYAQDERGFADVDKFREHLEWNHTALPVPAIPVISSSVSNCRVM
ncbi:hypothetical protein QBC47DRAFT_13839 [Echria macrotheca]|uniref:Uncharacterized protein n=1 Tax=Echria macrotheca TaxID=438768 RepID=A0AAJ0BM12_9PEZI|nr:hypothetical protein QBC47DRAFT_13839 [Echria macrotheca]